MRIQRDDGVEKNVDLYVCHNKSSDKLFKICHMTEFINGSPQIIVENPIVSCTDSEHGTETSATRKENLQNSEAPEAT